MLPLGGSCSHGIASAGTLSNQELAMSSEWRLRSFHAVVLICCFMVMCPKHFIFKEGKEDRKEIKSSFSKAQCEQCHTVILSYAKNDEYLSDSVLWLCHLSHFRVKKPRPRQRKWLIQGHRDGSLLCWEACVLSQAWSEKLNL